MSVSQPLLVRAAWLANSVPEAVVLVALILKVRKTYILNCHICSGADRLTAGLVRLGKKHF